jgi:hypothetical protein
MSLRLLNYNTILQLSGFSLLAMIIRPEKETENREFEIPVYSVQVYNWK